MAIKIFKPEFLNSGCGKARSIYIDELTALTTLDHPNVVKMYEYGIEGKLVSDMVTLTDIWYIVLEYISERTLVDLVKMHGSLDEYTAKFFFRQMIHTLVYINSKGIAHRDIKLENMLVNDQYQLKFADFGFASFSKEKQTQQKGTPIYFAPEILNKEEYDGEKVDVFSSGVVLFAFVSGKYPFTEASNHDRKYRLLMEHRHDEYWKPFEKYAYFSPECKLLIQSMLEYEPNQRATLVEITNSEWFNDYKEENALNLSN